MIKKKMTDPISKLNLFLLSQLIRGLARLPVVFRKSINSTSLGLFIVDDVECFAATLALFGVFGCAGTARTIDKRQYRRYEFDQLHFAAVPALDSEVHHHTSVLAGYCGKDVFNVGGEPKAQRSTRSANRILPVRACLKMRIPTLVPPHARQILPCAVMPGSILHPHPSQQISEMLDLTPKRLSEFVFVKVSLLI